MEIKILNEISPEIRKDYNKCLLSRQETLVYQSLPYHDLLKEHLGCKSVYFTCWNNSDLLATLPFLYKEDKKLGVVLNSLPYYGSNGSFVFNASLTESNKKNIAADLIKAFTSFAAFLNASAYTIITNPLTEDDWANTGLKYEFTDYRIGQITMLPPHGNHLEEKLMEIFSDPRPRNIRRAKTAGITTEVRYDTEALSFLHQIHRETIEGIGGKAKRKEFFEMIPKFLKPGEYAVYIACKEKTPVAGLLLFYFNKTIEYYTPATVQGFRNDQPSALLIFEAMKDGIKRGFQVWNWGGTWKSQRGVYDFKKRWGAVDFKYNYYTKVMNKELLQINQDDLVNAFHGFYLFPFNP